ncbi:MAG: NAD(P)-binding domain-containing protein, partial [Proteobacteria bacterium]|nr:NAD(P)-binding domain-containing protein [Pseudomonadota bacterium]
MSPRIGFIGLGMMGSAMAGRLEALGHALAVYSRTRDHALPFATRGALLCESPARVAASSTIVFSMISTSEALEAISLGDDGIQSGLPEKG